jgi:hypothetical protein
MMMTCREGDWFATPLSDRDYAVEATHLVCRAATSSVRNAEIFRRSMRSLVCVLAMPFSFGSGASWDRPNEVTDTGST